MEVKKSKKADLESKRVLFFQIGLVVTLGLILAAFEYSESYKVVNNNWEPVYHASYDEELPPLTRQSTDAKPFKMKPIQLTNLRIVDDFYELPDDLEFSTDPAPDAPSDFDLNKVSLEGEKNDEPTQFVLVEDKPEFPGGMEALQRFILKHIKYPQICQDMGIEGTVYISFVIDKDGKVTNIKLLHGTDRNLDKEAMRVIGMMPRWTPGKQRGEPVKVAFQMPVKFYLN